jgi:glycosyltransferase involved in cell wall biosynthesis
MTAVVRPEKIASKHSSNSETSARAMNVAMIATPRSEYMKYLCSALDELDDNLSLTAYTSVSGNMGYARNVKWGWVHNSWMAPFQVFRRITSDHPDVIHFQFEYITFGNPLLAASVPFLLLFFWISRAKVVTTSHYVIPFTDDSVINEVFPGGFKLPTTLTKIFLIILYSSLSRFCFATIVHADLFKHYLTSCYHFKSEKVHVIRHGVFLPEQDLKKTEKPLQFWKEKLKGKTVILCFGSVTPRKGLEYLVEAFHIVLGDHPNSLLVIAGLTNPEYHWYLEKIKSLIEKRGISNDVLVTGPVDYVSIHVLHDLADMVVLPYTISIGASGSFSFAVKHSKPIIASSVGIFREELSNGIDALLVPSRDAKALARAIEKLIDNEALGERLSTNLYRKMNERTWEKVAETTADVYRKIAGNRDSAQ